MESVVPTTSMSQEDRASKAVPLSVILPVRNEVLNVRAALESVRGWVDEIWIVDSGSSDGTLDIAREYTDNIVQCQYAGHDAKKRNWSIDNLPFRNEWVLILDADERITPELRAEIASAIKSDNADGYYLDREYIFLQRSLKCFRPNWNMRLLKHRLGRYEALGTNVPATGDNEVHEHLLLKGRTAFLRHPMLHEDFRPLRAWVDNHNRYSDWEAQVYQTLRKEPVTVKGLQIPVERNRQLKRLWVRLPFRPLARFAYFYFVKGGLRDGREGFLYCVLMGYYEFLIGVKLRELQKTHEQTPEAKPVGLQPD